MDRRSFTLAGLAAAAVGLSAGPGLAQSWPSQPIKLIVPFAAGGAADVMARVLAERLRAKLNQAVIVENVVGGGTMIATDQVARAAPDGYTFLVAASSHTINPNVTKVRYDPIRDFTPVTLLVSPLHVLVVGNDLPVKSVAEFIALAKAKPGTLTYGSVGFGTSTHMEAEMFAKMAGLDLVHVPYKGSAPALNDLIGGRLHFMFDALASSGAHIDAKSIRALGVTSARRSSLVPDLPTIAETGLPGYEAVPWLGLFGPAKLDPAIVARMNEALQSVLTESEVKARFSPLGLEILSYPPAQFAAFVSEDLAKWGKTAREAGIEAK
jgi:tripartite-type tricarboxylate transporter receptor subunit TctC